MVFACVNCICTIIVLTCVLSVYAHVYCLFMPCFAMFRNVALKKRHKDTKKFSNMQIVFAFFSKKMLFCVKTG